MENSKEILNSHLSGFEDIKQIDENGVEFWSARDLFPLLGYSTWQKFEEVIIRAKKSAFTSGQNIEDHFNQLVKMIEIGKNAIRKVMNTTIEAQQQRHVLGIMMEKRLNSLKVK